MRLTLINSTNPMASIVDPGASHWNRYAAWKPLRRNNSLDRAKLAAFEARFGERVAALVEATA